MYWVDLWGPDGVFFPFYFTSLQCLKFYNKQICSFIRDVMASYDLLPSLQDVEQEPPVRPPLPQELQESHQSTDHGWTESPYEVWTLDITSQKNMINSDIYFLFFSLSLSLLMFQGIYSHAVDPVHRRGNSQPDLLHVKAQKDTFGWHNTHRVHAKSDINTVACRLTFSDISNIKQLKQVSCSMPTGVVVSSTLIFPVFSFLLSLSPPTRPPSLPLCFSSIFIPSLESHSGSKGIPPDTTSQSTKVWFPIISCLLINDIWMYASEMLQISSHGRFFLIAITANFQFFDSLFFLAIRACCSACSGREGEAETRVSA